MEKENKKIIYELTVINHAYSNEALAVGKDEYRRHHERFMELYSFLSQEYNNILGTSNIRTEDELISYISTINLTSEQKTKLANLRKNPVFKKLFGEIALNNKKELEDVIGSEITVKGMTYESESRLQVAPKSEEILNEEWNSYAEKLTNLLASNKINQEQYNSYIQSLDYIYKYFLSISKGEQIPFRKLTTSEYINIDKMAEENLMTFDEQFDKINEDLKYDLEDVQEVSQEETHKKM